MEDSNLQKQLIRIFHNYTDSTIFSCVLMLNLSITTG